MLQLPIGALTDRVRALCFDLLARACEGATGWRLVRAELPSLLQKAVLPELALRSFDRSLWEMDEDEFVRRHMEGAALLHLCTHTARLCDTECAC